MSTLEQATQPLDRSGLSPAAPVGGLLSLNVPIGQQFPANPNPFLRCPIPPIAATPDNLRQYYLGGLIPQSRIMTPATLSQSVGGGGSSAVASTTSSSSTIKPVPSKIGTVSSASITTPVLNPGDIYTTSFGTSSTFVPLNLAVSSAARIELYATASAQTVDSIRPVTITPGPATQQGIFLDVSLDASPMSWQVTPSLPCSNGDSPQVALSYITVSNISQASVTITATLQYLILEL